jgi:hypothetical protein
MIDWETATASVVAPLPSSTAVVDGNLTPTVVATTMRPNLDMKIVSENDVSAETVTDHNMVLFVSSHRRIRHDIDY